MRTPRDIKIYFATPSLKHKILKSLECGASPDHRHSALEVTQAAAFELGADAIVFKKAPSAVHMQCGPLHTDAIQFLPEA